MKKYVNKYTVLPCIVYFMRFIACRYLSCSLSCCICFFAETTESQTVFSPYLYMEGKSCDELMEEYNFTHDPALQGGSVLIINQQLTLL